MRPPLLLPTDLNWSCIRCGRSCEDWSEVEIDADEADRLKRLPMLHPGLPSPPDATRPPFVEGEREPGLLLLRFDPTEDGARRCVLNDHDGLCAIHVQYGEEAKPVSCRAFPFSFIETPAGVRTALSFACTAIAHDLGDPVTDQMEPIVELQHLARNRENRGTTVLLAPGTPIAWADYAGLEQEMLRIVQHEPDPADVLVAQSTLIRERAGLTATELQPAPRLQEWALQWLVDQSGAPPRFRPPHPDLEPPNEATLLRRWLSHRIWRGDLLRGDDVLFAHGLMTSEITLACAWAALEECGLPEGVTQVERGLSHHSDIVDRINADDAARATAGRLFSAPRFAASMVLGVG